MSLEGNKYVKFKHELVLPNNDLPFKMFVFEGMEGNYQVVKHWHNSIEIFLVLEGNIDFYINSSHYPLKENQLILVNSNEIHSINAPKSNQTIVLQIPIQSFEQYTMEEQFLWFHNVELEHSEDLIDTIRYMYEIYQAKEYGYELEVKSYFYHLLYLLVTKHQENAIDKERIEWNRNLKKLSKITSYIMENHTSEFSLISVAKVFGFSPTYLSRMFQKYAEINYKSYVQNVRVEFAYKELVNTNLSIEQISINNGFANSKSFSKAFHKRYGSLPSEYRKNLKRARKCH